MQAETKKSGFIHEKIYGMPMWIMLIFVAVIYVGTFTKMLPADDMLSIVAIMFSIGFCIFWGSGTGIFQNSGSSVLRIHHFLL